jgi:hypothetical protein
VSPASDAQDANGAAPIKVTFNDPLAAGTPVPVLSPRIPGNWTVSRDSITFQPRAGYTSGTHVTLSIPGGSTGVQAAGLAASDTATTAQTGSGLLAKSATVSFTTGSYSTLRLQQQPSSATCRSPSSRPPGHRQRRRNAQLSAAYDPSAGSFTFQCGYPRS